MPAYSRDYQLIGANNILISATDGYREYSLETRQVHKEVKGFEAVGFARRRSDGTTVLGRNGNSFAEIIESGCAGQGGAHRSFRQWPLLRWQGKDDPLVPSGLLGPVRLVRAE